MKNTRLAVLLVAALSFSFFAAGEDAKAPAVQANAGIVPTDKPENLVAQALGAMKTGIWHVEVSLQGMDETGKASGQVQVEMNGLLSGEDFDVTTEHEGKITGRVIGIAGKTWGTTDGGKNWKVAARAPGNTALYFTPTPTPFSDGTRIATLYEIVGTEIHDGETWVHIHAINGRGMRYWLLLDKAGKGVSVRRCSFSMGQGSVFGPHEIDLTRVEDFTPAKAGEKITPPEEGK